MTFLEPLSYDIIIIGGGAAGFFTAINAAEMAPEARICILERGKELLTKVRISGGGRCNVTHAEFLPKELTRNYPRGEKELRGPFHSFMTGDTIEWFEKRGVPLKIEEDGRMFPESNSSETIIDLFLEESKRLNIEVLTKRAVQGLKQKDGRWEVTTSQENFTTEKVLVATGSNPKMWEMLKDLGHTVVPGVPSLFTFKITDARIKDLPGVATDAVVRVKREKLETSGPLLITHWGMSGPAILKLSAWGARELSDKKNFEIEVNWLPEVSPEEITKELQRLKKENAKQHPQNYAQFGLPKRLWQSLVNASGIGVEVRWADLNKQQLEELTNQLSCGTFQVHGKSTFKEEFVTAGGVELKEVNFKTFESKVCKNLFLAGEVLNIDAITGGFNFQNAWTGGFLAAKAMTTDSVA
ncbi:BaiN/RdsA family NAD(P)/FAD-dependent oxidoreductase [Salinimicrobium sediminilitoris]|uniref:NAD(P)/FAD-dependent oxidoreductase n=1 Tax=Salinimicrobium sediminilitoris TaxID=2876715 RepID=UPI001E33091D|nr:NAD(P)/FAD-dependent oxidoreductase [Salinimicrobium sediminilitoris]MCC8361137.1 NAD(P)/FAD-dependent oxidoreductase [Salinimicrobium sediminilitoris]